MTDQPSPENVESTAPTDEESRPEAERRPEAQQTPDGETVPRHERREGRHRERLREAEAERDELRRMLNDRDRAEAERLAADLLLNPADLWLLIGDDPTPLRDETGRVSADRMTALLADQLADRPYLRRSSYGVARNGDTGPRGRAIPRPPEGWDKVIRR